MMNKLTATILLFFAFIGHSLLAQGLSVTGQITDTTGFLQVPKVLVMAVRAKDSVLIDYKRSNASGVFKFQELPNDTLLFIITHPNYDDRELIVLGGKNHESIDFGPIKMSDKSEQIQEVVIYANRQPIHFNGDTLVYQANSFKVAQNAVVEDLLKRLPGIKVDKEGKITSQGKDVDRLLVDGDEFFGADPTVATKNLGANGVETVEVYEKKTQNAQGEEETQQVMNIKLKEEAKKGYFGKVSLASDGNKFYEGEALANKFNSVQKLSVFALASNTPHSGFNWNDINKFGLDNESNFTQTEDGYYMMNEDNSSQGIPQTFKGGFYYSDKYGKKQQTKFNVNYTFNQATLKTFAQSRSNYLLSDTTYYTDDSTRTLKNTSSHSVNMKLTSQLDSLTFLEFYPTFQLTDGTTSSAEYSTYLNRDNSPTRTNEINKKDVSNGSSIKSNLILTRKFKKKRRLLSVDFKQEYIQNSTSSLLGSYNAVFSNSSNDTIAQSKTNSNLSTNYQSIITYVEPINKKMRLEFELMNDYGNKHQKKETFDALNGSYSVYNGLYSNDFKTDKFQNRIGLSYVYDVKKFTFTGTARFRNIQINNINQLTDSTIQQNINNFLPKLQWTYHPSNNKRIRIAYTTLSNQPTLNALQPVQDNSNPNWIQVGNPSLKPNYTHRLSLFMNKWNPISRNYYWVTGDFRILQNDFANSTVYDSLGRQYSQTINVSGNQNADLNAGFGYNLYKTIIGLNVSMNYNYQKNINYINSFKNLTLNNSFTPNINLNFMFDSLYFGLSSNVSYIIPKNTLNTISNKPYTNQVYSIDCEWKLPIAHLKVNTDVTYTINGKRANGYNVSYLIWNASLTKAFLKTENLLLSIQANDILNQNISAQRQINGNIITDYKTNIIKRYVLFKLTYKFNNNKTKEEDEEEWY